MKHRFRWGPASKFCPEDAGAEFPHSNEAANSSRRFVRVVASRGLLGGAILFGC